LPTNSSEFRRRFSLASRIIETEQSFRYDGGVRRVPANESMFESILLDSAIVIGLLHLGLPLVVKGTYRFSAHCKGTRLSLEELTADAASLVAARIPQLQALRFEFLGCCDFGKLAMETRTIVVSFLHEQTQELANVWVSLSDRKASSYLEFCTHSPEGVSLETSSNGILPLAPENPEIRVFRFPELSEIAELHRIHRQIVAKYADNGWIQPEPQGLGLKRITRTIENYGPRLCKLGYLQPSANGEWYGLTWKGAFRTAWTGMWPIAAIRRAMARHEMRNELRSLEVHGTARLQKA
jgi:hypothetical protein